MHNTKVLTVVDVRVCVRHCKRVLSLQAKWSWLRILPHCEAKRSVCVYFQLQNLTFSEL